MNKGVCGDLTMVVIYIGYTEDGALLPGIYKADVILGAHSCKAVCHRHADDFPIVQSLYLQKVSASSM